LDQISTEKGINKDILIDAVKTAMEAAARKRWPEMKNIHSTFNPETGEVDIFVEKTVVKTVEDPAEQITLKEARKISRDAEVGETVLVRQVLADYGRIAAQLAKQVILQKVREAEIDNTYNEFKDKKGELINGIAQRMERGDFIIDLGKAEGVLPRREQVFRETFNRGERIRAYVLDVKKTPKNAMVILSRTHTGLIRRLFEMEVPEISEGMVEIMGIVREPNGRTKIAVRTNDRDIDAVGACVGMRGMRVQSIVQELRGEKIDIVEYSEEPEVFIRHALSPAKISRIIRNDAEKHMIIIVPDDQMSLAIGKKGQNVRLAAKLVKWKIDIKGEAEAININEATAFLSRPKPRKVDFLEEIKNTKGLGPKIMSILFAHDMVSFEATLKRGLEGLTELQNIGPKKAEAILKVAEEQKRLVDLETAEVPAVESGESPSASVEPGTEVQPAVPGEEEEVEEDTDIAIDELVGIDAEIISALHTNGFETLAELSITPAEELLQVEGVDEAIAQMIINQAKQRVDNLENV